MQPDKKYLKWCTKQNKGIKVVKESENMKKAYLKKSREALRSMEVNAKEGINEWAVSASYYAKYFAVYALLSRIGVKCEIHDCTIALFGYLFLDEIPSTFIQDLRQAKDDLVDAQYYTLAVKINSAELIAKTKDFVLKIEEIIDGLTPQKIADARKKLKAVL